MTDLASFIDAAGVDDLKLILAEVENRLTQAGALTRMRVQGFGSVDVSDGTKHLTPEEMTLAENAFEAWFRAAANKDQRRSRSRVLLAFLLVRHGGLRLGEALALDDGKDFHFHTNTLQVGGNHARLVLFSRRVMRVMQALVESPLFADMRGNILTLDQGYLRRVFSHRAKECGLPKGLCNPRTLRLSRQIELLRGGVPAQVVDVYMGRQKPPGLSQALDFPTTAVQRVIQQYIQREDAMKTSARNAFTGKVTNIRQDSVLAEVELTTLNGLHVVSVITEDSLTALGLEQGSAVTATVKAPWVILTELQNGLKTSARNQFPGTVATVKASDIACEVVVDLDAGGSVCALITRESLEKLALAPGKEVLTMFKAFSVILNIE
ncbi:TOBE domain-containing protein [Desulfovibrio sp. OttesenSCG-928-G15]|nr:TOBE domain-containing protein [Desulfovibrio sp. OttesenSCG-928-G15]